MNTMTNVITTIFAICMLVTISVTKSNENADKNKKKQSIADLA